MSITSLTNELLDTITLELKKKKNMDKIYNNVMDPLLTYTSKKIAPYIIILFVILILTFLIIIIILLLIIRSSFQMYNKNIK